MKWVVGAILGLLALAAVGYWLATRWLFTTITVTSPPPPLEIEVPEVTTAQGGGPKYFGFASGGGSRSFTTLPVRPGTSMFRFGQALDGVAEGSLPDSLQLLWSFKTGGPVKSSPAIRGGKVFIGSDDGCAYAIALRTGREVWSFQTDDSVQSSPCVLMGTVFVGSDDHCLYALDEDAGQLIWKYKTEDKIVGAPNWFSARQADGPPASAPAAPAGPGAPWAATSALATASAPARPPPWLRVLVGSYDNKLHCVNAATGQAAWTYESGSYINGAPAVESGLAVFGGCDKFIHAVRLADGAADAVIETDSYMAGSAALADGRAYLGNYDGKFFCVDLSAKTVVWEYVSEKNAFFSSPAVGGDRVVVGCRDKSVYAFNRRTGEKLWSFPTGGEVDSSPVICGDKVVVGSNDGRLYVLRFSDGTKLWSYDLGESVAGSPAVAEGMIVVGCDDGKVYAFGRK